MALRRILAIKTRALGDTVILTAALVELRKAHPEAKIEVVVPEAWAPLLEGHSAVDRVWPLARRRRSMALAWLAARLRFRRFDAVVCFHASPSSAWLARMTGASLRSVHFHGHTDANRHSTVEIAGKGTVKPAIERDMDAVRALGVDVASGAAMPSIVLREDEKAAARAWLDRGKLPQPLLTIGLGASRPTKSWPVERYAALATAWHARTGGGIVALAGPDESSLLQLFVESLGTGDRRPPVLCESRLSVRQLAAVLACARVHVGNDSGPKHLAIAVGTRTVTLFGPEHPLEWHPYPADLHPFLFVEGLPCRRDAHPGMPPWCGLQVCTEEKHKCMRMIPVDRVLERCLETQGP